MSRSPILLLVFNPIRPSPLQIALPNQRKALTDEQLGCQRGVFDVKGDRRAAGADQEGVDVVDVDLGGEEGGADGDEGLAGALGELDGEEFGFGEGDAGGAEEFAAEGGVAADQSDEGGVAGFLDGERDDATDAFPRQRTRFWSRPTLFSRKMVNCRTRGGSKPAPCSVRGGRRSSITAR